MYNKGVRAAVPLTASRKMTSFAITDNLDWAVEQRPIYYPDVEGNLIRFGDRVAIVRSDNEYPLGVVSDGYETVQNKELMSLITPMVEEGVLSIENIGFLNNGAKVFIQSKIAKDFRIIGEDYRAFVTLLNGHVGNACVAIGSSNIRVICNNTFAMAYSSLSGKYRHSEGVNERILESQAVIEYVDNSMAAYAASADSLASTKCSKDQFHNFLEKTYKKEIKEMRGNFVDQLNNLFYNGVGTEGKTLYDAFNAVTYYGSHESRKTEEGRFNFVNFGTGSRIGQRAMNIALELAS